MTDDMLYDPHKRPFGAVVEVTDERRTLLLSLLYKVVAAQTAKGEKPPAQEPDLWALKTGPWSVCYNGHAEEYFLWTGAPVLPGSFAFEYAGYLCGELIMDSDGVRLSFAEGKLDEFIIALTQEI